MSEALRSLHPPVHLLPCALHIWLAKAWRSLPSRSAHASPQMARHRLPAQAWELVRSAAHPRSRHRRLGRRPAVRQRRPCSALVPRTVGTLCSTARGWYVQEHPHKARYKESHAPSCSLSLAPSLPSVARRRSGGSLGRRGQPQPYRLYLLSDMWLVCRWTKHIFGGGSMQFMRAGAMPVVAFAISNEGRRHEGRRGWSGREQ